jgi:hypothetical protein
MARIHFYEIPYSNPEERQEEEGGGPWEARVIF